LEIDNVIREAILRKASASETRELAHAQGMVPMIEDGFCKAARGLTTIEEVVRMRHE
jgi:type II secretory ATPase GspE/PulE/Tfp pilus assembly ATPase PilB-like protein